MLSTTTREVKEAQTASVLARQVEWAWPSWSGANLGVGGRARYAGLPVLPLLVSEVVVSRAGLSLQVR